MSYSYLNQRAWLFLAVFASLLFAGCSRTAYKITPVPADQELRETTLIDEGGLFPTKILLIDVDGILLDGRKPSLFGEGEHPVATFVEKLNKAADDPAVKAVVLRINSPGGAVTAADIMYQELLLYKQCTGKPVTAVLMDVAASGGYYVACGADEIVAHPTTVTGSVGVIMQLFNFAGTMNKIGAESNAITSGKMKDAGSPFRQLRPEERAIFQGLVEQFYDRFVQVVVDGRPNLTEERVRELADGRVWSAQQALELGFIDRVGTLRETLACLKERLEVSRVRVVTYQRPLDYKPNIYAQSPTSAGTGTEINLLQLQFPQGLPNSSPMFMYLWAPGM